MKPPPLRSCLWAALALSAFFLTHLCAAEEEAARALQALETALHDEAAAAGTAAGPAEEANEAASAPATGYDLTQDWVLQLSAALKRGDAEQAERLVAQVTASSKSAAVQIAGAKLREEIQRERETKEQSVLKRLRATEADAERAVKSATVPSDLDGALRELSTAGEALDYRTSTAVQGEVNHIQSLRRYVILWQDYLASREHGDNQAAQEKLRSISQDPCADTFPRSEILDRIAADKQLQQRSMDERTREILGQLKGPEQIAEVEQELSALLKEAGNDFSVGPVRTNLNGILGQIALCADLFGAFQAGLPIAIQSLPYSSGPNQPDSPAEVQNLKAQLLRQWCVRELSPGETIMPGASESIPEYLNRLMVDAKERGDARMIVRVRELQRKTSPHVNPVLAPPDSPEFTAALQAMVSAQNEAEAGQFIPAVVSYEKALKNGGDVVPAKAIGARLDAIKAAHPEEYKEGLQIALGIANGAG